MAANQALRQALQTAIGEGEMLAAGFGDTRFFIAEGNHFPKGTPFYSAAGTDALQRAQSAKCQGAAEQAGYKGEPVRMLTSRQYDFHYNMALIMAEQLKRAGFKAELTWSSGPRCCNAAPTRSYGTSTSRTPACSPSRCCRRRNWATARRAGGASPAKQAALAAFNQRGRSRPSAAPLWGKVQQVVYDEVPYIHVGKFASLSARAPGAAELQARHLAVLLEHELK